MWRRIASWRARQAARAAGAVADRPDRAKVADMGDALRTSYEQADDSLDDRLVTLMLELSVEPSDGKPPRRKP